MGFRPQTASVSPRLRPLKIEQLERRDLLTASQFSVVEPDRAIMADFATMQASVRQTALGPAQELGVLDESLTLQDSLGGSNAFDLFTFTTAEATELNLTLTGKDSLTFYLVNSQRPTERTSGSPDDGRVSATLSPGDHFLIVIDTTFTRSDYALEFSLPSPEPVLDEFPEVPYIGRAFDWNLNTVNAPEVWAQGFTGAGTVVAVIDTGVDFSHPDLNDNIWVNPGEIAGDNIDNDRNGYVDDIYGWDFAYGDNNPMDVNGHGTHVAGTIAAERNGQGTTGVAYDATILPVKVLRDNGSGSSFAIANGIRYAVDVGADIINLSLGGGVSRAIQNAIQYAFANDVLVVAASGNDAASRPGAPAIFSSVLPNTISVGAHDQFDNLAGFSNRVGTTGSVQIDAPGARIASTYPGGDYRYLSGTSMAAPHVAGVAALALSASGDLSARDLRDLLTTGANQLIARSDSIGGVNAARTVARAYQFDLDSKVSRARTNTSLGQLGRSNRTAGLTSVQPDVPAELAAAAIDDEYVPPAPLVPQVVDQVVETNTSNRKPSPRLEDYVVDTLFSARDDFGSPVNAADLTDGSAEQALQGLELA